MKKRKIIISIILIILVILLLITFYIKINNNTLNVNSNFQNRILSAEEVLNKLKEKNSNIGTYVVYNEDNDLNKLLGRPNQYTSKVTFEDIRLEQKNKLLDPNYFSQDEINEPIGGTIEVFNNKEDLQKRKTYVESVSSSISTLVEYSYSNDYILLRLNKELTPSQASEYENIFNEVFY